MRTGIEVNVSATDRVQLDAIVVDRNSPQTPDGLLHNKYGGNLCGYERTVRPTCDVRARSASGSGRTTWRDACTRQSTQI